MMFFGHWVLHCGVEEWLPYWAHNPKTVVRTHPPQPIIIIFINWRVLTGLEVHKRNLCRLDWRDVKIRLAKVVGETE